MRRIRSGLRGLRYQLADFAGLIGRGLAAAGRSLTRIPVHARRRIIFALAAVAAIAVIALVVVPKLPCEAPGGDRCPPADEAEKLVPADSLAYLHLNVDPETEQAADLAAVAERLPLFTSQIADRAAALIPGPDGAPPSFEQDLEPWFGGEASLAVVPGPGTAAEQVVLLEVDDAEGAAEFATSIATGTTSQSDYQGVEIASDERDIATAQTGGFLVIGSPAGVRAIVDVATEADGTVALADDAEAQRVRDELPDHRFLDAWVSADGASRLLGSDSPSAVLSSLAPFVSPSSTEGAALALSADEEETLELALRSALDPEREQSSPGFFAAFPPFEPTLDEDLPDDSLAYLGIGTPGETIEALLGQAAAQAPGIADSFGDLAETLREEGQFDVERDLLPAFGDEAAFAIESGEAAPFLEFVAKGVDEEKTRQALASLQQPLADAVNPGSDLQAPVFGDQQVGGEDVSSLRLSPALELYYAVFDGLAVIANDPLGIERLATGDGGLEDAERFERATEGFEDELSMLAYFDLRQLLDQGFRIGLAQVPAFNTFAEEFRSLEALGLAVSTSSDLLGTDARLVIDAPSSSDSLVSPGND